MTTVTTKGTKRLRQCLALQKSDKLTIVLHGLPERWADTKHDSREYVLKTGYQKESRVFRVRYVRILGIKVWRNEPWPWLAKTVRLQEAYLPTMLAAAQIQIPTTEQLYTALLDPVTA